MSEKKATDLGFFGRIHVAQFDSTLSGMALITFAAMTSFGPACRASIKAIARRARLHPDSVRKAQKELVAAGWIELLKEGGLSKDNEPREWIINAYPPGTFPSPPLTPAPPKQEGLDQPLSTQVTESSTVLGKKSKKKIAADEYSPEFLQARELYRDTKGSKPAAWAMWRKKFGPQGPASDFYLGICAAIEWQIESEDFTKEQGKFKPHFSSWLSKEYWEKQKPEGGGPRKTAGRVVL